MHLTDAEKAYHEIREKIITVEMSPGSVIREADLIEKLDLGRTPIREALKRLQAENLVLIIPRQGVFVADIAITDLQQIYEVRVELEPLCARLATERITPEQLKQMQQLISEYERINKDDKKLIIDMDHQFHHHLAKAAGNKFLHSQFEQFYNLSVRIWHLALNNLQPADLDVEAHIRIVDAVEARDCRQAGKEMRKHIQQFHDRIKRYL